MQRTETPTVMQSLLMIYAHLVNSEFDAVLNFLSTVPGPTGESALAFVLIEWVSKQQLFYGNYDRKVATIALCKILEYGVTHDDCRLNEITVDGDLIFSGKQVSYCNFEYHHSYSVLNLSGIVRSPNSARNISTVKNVTVI